MRTLLKSMFTSPKETVSTVPEGHRVYAIGDIHGRIDLLVKLHEAMLDDMASAFARQQQITVVYLGDYIDRGPGSREVIDYLSGEWSPQVRPVFLRGNHEATLQNFLSDAGVLDAWRNFGGLETLVSYGVDLSALRAPGGAERIRQDFRARFPSAHLHFMENLQNTAMIGDYLFVHAGIRPGIALERQSSDDLLWIRDEFLESRAAHGKIIVHGHSPAEEPEIWPNRINIDTGAYLTGRLTCLVLDGHEKRCL